MVPWRILVIFRSALEHQASGIILFHNHPSGQLRPSEADIQLTRKLVAAGRVLTWPYWTTHRRLHQDSSASLTRECSRHGRSLHLLTIIGARPRSSKAMPEPRGPGPLRAA